MKAGVGFYRVKIKDSDLRKCIFAATTNHRVGQF